jgi:dephospho-CoA kinase
MQNDAFEANIALAAKDAELEQALAAKVRQAQNAQYLLQRLMHRLVQDEMAAAKDAQLEQALATVTAAKVCFFRTISLSQRD